MKAFDGPLGAFLRAAAREVPALANELVRGRHFQAVPHLGPVDDPSTVFAKGLLHLTDGHINGMPRDERAVPRFRDHLVVADRAAAVLQEDAKHLQCLGPQPDLGVVA